jgi:hypothetical protein
MYVGKTNDIRTSPTQKLETRAGPTKVADFTDIEFKTRKKRPKMLITMLEDRIRPVNKLKLLVK